MLWYGQITVQTSNVDFGVVNVGTGFADNVNEVTGIYINNYIKRRLLGTGKILRKYGLVVTYNADFDDTGVCANPNDFHLWLV